MNTTLTQNQLSGRATGALFFTGFGAIWITLGLYAREILSIASVSAVVIGSMALLATIVWLFRQSKLFTKLPDDPALSRAFNRINAVQWIAGGIAAFTLGRIHRDVYIVSAITTIVGLHLFPLAKLFRYPLHYATAIALVLWAGLGLLVVPPNQLQGQLPGTTALGTGVILWLSAAISLVINIRAVRHATHSEASRYTQHLSV